MNEIDESKLIQIKQFAKFAGPDFSAMDDLQYNYCPKCRIPMELTMAAYHCSCGIVVEGVDASKNLDEIGNGAVRSSTGSSAGKVQNINDDYSVTQKKVIVSQLAQNARVYTGPAFAPEILAAAAEQYNLIQKFIVEEERDEQGHITESKKFVKRGDLKGEILCALIYFEGIRHNIVRKKKDISEFMRRPTSGFARGEGIVRDLHAEGKIDIPVDDEPICGFLDRYLEALNLDDKYADFITEIVERSELRKIGMASQISSKIVGALWIVIVKTGLKISAADLEKAADNTRKGTFLKFYNAVFENYSVFADIFNKHGVKK